MTKYFREASVVKMFSWDDITGINVMRSHGSGQVGFVVDKMVLGQVFSEYFGFPCLVT
jgi:hypothetical protein